MISDSVLVRMARLHGGGINIGCSSAYDPRTKDSDSGFGSKSKACCICALPVVRIMYLVKSEMCYITDSYRIQSHFIIEQFRGCIDIFLFTCKAPQQHWSSCKMILPYIVSPTAFFRSIPHRKGTVFQFCNVGLSGIL